MLLNKVYDPVKREKTFTNADLPWIPVGFTLVDSGAKESLYSPSGIWLAAISSYGDKHINPVVKEDADLLSRVSFILNARTEYNDRKARERKEAADRAARKKAQQDLEVLRKELL